MFLSCNRVLQSQDLVLQSQVGLTWAGGCLTLKCWLEESRSSSFASRAAICFENQVHRFDGLVDESFDYLFHVFAWSLQDLLNDSCHDILFLCPIGATGFRFFESLCRYLGRAGELQRACLPSRRLFFRLLVTTVHSDVSSVALKLESCVLVLYP